MSDEAIRRWERELQRAGLDPVEIARDILRRQPARFWALTTSPRNNLSESCKVTYKGGRDLDALIKFRTPLHLIEDVTEVSFIPSIIYDCVSQTTTGKIPVTMAPSIGIRLHPDYDPGDTDEGD